MVEICACGHKEEDHIRGQWCQRYNYNRENKCTCAMYQHYITLSQKDIYLLTDEQQIPDVDETF